MIIKSIQYQIVCENANKIDGCRSYIDFAEYDKSGPKKHALKQGYKFINGRLYCRECAKAQLTNHQ